MFFAHAAQGVFGGCLDMLCALFITQIAQLCRVAAALPELSQYLMHDVAALGGAEADVRGHESSGAHPVTQLCIQGAQCLGFQHRGASAHRCTVSRAHGWQRCIGDTLQRSRMGELCHVGAKRIQFDRVCRLGIAEQVAQPLVHAVFLAGETDHNFAACIQQVCGKFSGQFQLPFRTGARHFPVLLPLNR